MEAFRTHGCRNRVRTDGIRSATISFYQNCKKSGGKSYEDEAVETCGNMDMHHTDGHDGSRRRGDGAGRGKRRGATSEQCKENSSGAVHDQNRGCRDGPGHSSC